MSPRRNFFEGSLYRYPPKLMNLQRFFSFVSFHNCLYLVRYEMDVIPLQQEISRLWSNDAIQGFFINLQSFCHILFSKVLQLHISPKLSSSQGRVKPNLEEEKRNTDSKTCTGYTYPPLFSRWHRPLSVPILFCASGISQTSRPRLGCDSIMLYYGCLLHICLVS